MNSAPLRPQIELWQRASLLLHHLLNQSLSSLDFCILWQELTSSNSELAEVDQLVSNFLNTANLTALDQALALLPEPEGTLLPAITVRQAVVQNSWNVESKRIRDVSRADFRCQECGWEITLSQEHEANTEMRLPFDNLVCPLCEDSSDPDQGSAE